MTWERILTHWNLLEADLQENGVDLTPELLRSRSWRWLAVRVGGLLAKPPAFVTDDGRPVPSTRLGMALNPPGPPRRR